MTEDMVLKVAQAAIRYRCKAKRMKYPNGSVAKVAAAGSLHQDDEKALKAMCEAMFDIEHAMWAKGATLV